MENLNMYYNTIAEDVFRKLKVKEVELSFHVSKEDPKKVDICFSTEEDDTYSYANNVKRKNVFKIMCSWMTSKKVEWMRDGRKV